MPCIRPRLLAVKRGIVSFFSAAAALTVPSALGCQHADPRLRWLPCHGHGQERRLPRNPQLGAIPGARAVQGEEGICLDIFES